MDVPQVDEKNFLFNKWCQTFGGIDHLPELIHQTCLMEDRKNQSNAMKQRISTYVEANAEQIFGWKLNWVKNRTGKQGDQALAVLKRDLKEKVVGIFSSSVYRSSPVQYFVAWVNAADLKGNSAFNMEDFSHLTALRLLVLEQESRKQEENNQSMVLDPSGYSEQ